jgi:hypothetical protein
MQMNDQDEFKQMLQEMAAMYRGTIYNDFFAGAYWKILKPYSLAAVRRACLDLLGNEMRKQAMPTAADIKSLARRYEPPPKPSRAEGDEERWRRRYDAWEAGGFSDDALAMVFMMTDEEMAVGAEGDLTSICCQEPHCQRLIPWPSDTGQRQCKVHRIEGPHGATVTRAEKIEIARSLTPKGRAFLRSAVPQLMEDIPITDEEEKFTEMPFRGIPEKLSTYLKTVDAQTAAAIVENYQSR